MYKFKAYTDGACSGNPGIGGWGAVLLAEKNNEIKIILLNNNINYSTRHDYYFLRIIAVQCFLDSWFG